MRRGTRLAGRGRRFLEQESPTPYGLNLADAMQIYPISCVHFYVHITEGQNIKSTGSRGNFSTYSLWVLYVCSMPHSPRPSSLSTYSTGSTYDRTALNTTHDTEYIKNTKNIFFFFIKNRSRIRRIRREARQPPFFFVFGSTYDPIEDP